jgi:hypothetical protein
MELEDLLRLLEIDACEDFAFFEYYAALVENDEDIPFDALRALFAAVDRSVLADLTEGYFEETLGSVPDDQTEFYTLLDAIGRNLAQLAKNAAERGVDIFTEEFLRFRQWYVADGAVHCANKATGAPCDAPVRDALTLSRLEKLGDPDYFFDFNDCLDYPLSAYVYYPEGD